MMNDLPRAASELLATIRGISISQGSALDAATRSLGDTEKVLLAAELTRVADHIASRVGSSRGLPPPGTLPPAGIERIDLSAQPTAVPVAGMFVRNTVIRWLWVDLLTATECVVHDLTTAFIDALTACELAHPTRMSLRLRSAASGRLIVEVRDSPENAHLIAHAGRLISDRVERMSVRCGQHCAGGRTVLWSELRRPEFGDRQL